jgi:hypothetical protein
MSSLKILAAVAAAATVSLAMAQGVPPKPAADPAVGAGQRSTQNTPMGSTGTPGGAGAGASAQGSTAGSSAATTTGSTGASSSGSMNSGSSMSSSSPSASSSDTMASDSQTTSKKSKRVAKADRN